MFKYNECNKMSILLFFYNIILSNTRFHLVMFQIDFQRLEVFSNITRTWGEMWLITKYSISDLSSLMFGHHADPPGIHLKIRMDIIVEIISVTYLIHYIPTLLYTNIAYQLLCERRLLLDDHETGCTCMLQNLRFVPSSPTTKK